MVTTVVCSTTTVKQYLIGRVFVQMFTVSCLKSTVMTVRDTICVKVEIQATSLICVNRNVAC